MVKTINNQYCYSMNAHKTTDLLKDLDIVAEQSIGTVSIGAKCPSTQCACAKYSFETVYGGDKEPEH